MPCQVCVRRTDSDGWPDYLDDDDDDDGAPTLCEDLANTNELVFDTDDDTVADGDEMGPDCFNFWDTDNDGVIDALDTDDIRTGRLPAEA